MKKTVLTVLILLLLALTFPSVPRVPKVSATAEDLWTTPGLPEDVPSEPMPENYTTEDYLNTTNPYSQINPLGEENETEGSQPLYVLVFGDEEERDVLRWWDNPLMRYGWGGWARLQLERGDEALVANFGIDIRILDFLEWDSADHLNTMYDLWYELEEDTEQYLRQWYSGQWWSNYVDAIIGITSQVDPNPAGLAPGPGFLDQGRNFILLNWLVYWADDNLVQHEVSHLYYAPDHLEHCCPMASHTHYQTWIWEDIIWWVFSDIHCSKTAYSWCTSCHQVIQQNSGRYPLRTLTISASSGGTTDPTPETYFYGNGESVAVTASAYSGYTFNYWLLDGVDCGSDLTITVTMDSDHTLTAYFNAPPNTPSPPSGPTTVYRNVWYPYSTSATDPDGDDIRYHLSATGPGNPYENTTIWVDSGTPMSWNLLWEPTDSPGTYLIQTWVEDAHGALSGMSSLSVTMVGIHDVAVASVVSDKTTVGQTYLANVSVAVENQGEYAEQVNVILYADSYYTYTVETKQVTLSIGESRTLTYVWDTTGFPHYDYTLIAVVQIIGYSDDDPTDNGVIDGSILVTIAGDVDGDHDVDIYDIVLIASKYGAIKGEPSYLSDCDLDNDGDIDIYDLVIAQAYFGQSW